MTLQDCFARIINLDDRTDKWNAVKHLNVERFSAVKVNDQDALQHLCLRAQAELASGRRVSEGIPSGGAVGCSLSHIAVWKEFLASKKSFCLVLEDDINCSLSDLETAVAELLKESFEIGLLGWTTPLRRPLTLHPTDASLVVPWPRGQCFYGSHAYILTRDACTRLLLESTPIQLQIDFYLQAQAWRWKMRIRKGNYQFRQLKTFSSDVMSISNFCFNCEPWWDKAVLSVAALAFVLVLLQIK